MRGLPIYYLAQHHILQEIGNSYETDYTCFDSSMLLILIRGNPLCATALIR